MGTPDGSLTMRSHCPLYHEFPDGSGKPRRGENTLGHKMTNQKAQAEVPTSQPPTKNDVKMSVDHSDRRDVKKYASPAAPARMDRHGYPILSVGDRACQMIGCLSEAAQAIKLVTQRHSLFYSSFSLSGTIPTNGTYPTCLLSWRSPYPETRLHATNTVRSNACPCEMFGFLHAC